MKKLHFAALVALACALVAGPALASDDSLTARNAAGSPITICSKDTGAGVMAACNQLVDTSGTKVSPATSGNQTTANTALGTIATGVGAPTDTACASSVSTCAEIAILKGLLGASLDTSTESPTKTADGSNAALGAKADSACSTDNGTCDEIALIKRANQRLSSLITAVGAPAQAGATKHFVSSTLTRIANTTAYTATATAPQTVCLFTSTTVCAPLTITVSSTTTVNGLILNLGLVKSTTGATAATFRILAYQAAPTLTSTFDATTYTPKLADITSGARIGAWTCATQVVNGDNSSYECTADAGDGHRAFNLTDGILRFLVETTGAYAPGSGETFNVIADIVASAP